MGFGTVFATLSFILVFGAMAVFVVNVQENIITASATIQAQHEELRREQLTQIRVEHIEHTQNKELFWITEYKDQFDTGTHQNTTAPGDFITLPQGVSSGSYISRIYDTGYPSTFTTILTTAIIPLDPTTGSSLSSIQPLFPGLTSAVYEFSEMRFDGPPVGASSFDCFAPANIGTIGPTGSLCEGMLIVSRTMLRSAASSFITIGGDQSFSLTGPDGLEYTFADSSRNVFTGQVTDLSNLFRGTSFNGDIGYWDTRNVVTMREMFRAANQFNQDLNSWNTSSVTDLSAMFWEASSFNGDISSWDVSSVADFSSMFWFATSFNQDLSSWDVSSAITIRRMFRGANQFNQNLNSWDVSSVTDMNELFFGASSFNGNISSWDVSSVLDMEGLFRSASSFTGDVSSWDVSSVLGMDFMFDGANSFSGDLSSWNVSSVNSMRFLFRSASSFSSDLSSWDVSSVTTMESMFQGASTFSSDLSSWDVSSITSMYRMFWLAGTFNSDISSWDVSGVTDMREMFRSAAQFNQDISAWCVEQIPTKPTNFDLASGFANQNALQPNWGASCFFIEINSPEPLTYSLSEVLINISVFSLNPVDTIWYDWNGSQTIYTQPEIIFFPDGMHTLFAFANDTTGALVSANVTFSVVSDCFSPSAVGSIGPAGTICENMLIVDETALYSAGASFMGGDESFSITGPDGFEYTFEDSSRNIFTGQVITMTGLFDTTTFNGDIGYWDTRNVVNMDYLFHFNSDFNQDISAWDVSSVIDMTHAFSFASSFNQPLSSWDVSSVQRMGGMFWSASSFNQPLSSWDTSSVIEMYNMFEASSFNQPLSSWDVSSVTDMGNMFSAATAFNQPLASWDVSSVTDMQSMFAGASAFNQDISSWNVAAVASMQNMFAGASAFNQDISSWCVSQIIIKPIGFDTNAGFAGQTALQPNWGGACLDASATIGIQIRTANDIQTLLSRPFVGPDGTTNTRYVTAQTINSMHNNQRYIQYRALFTADQTPPQLHNVAIGIRRNTAHTTITLLNTGSTKLIPEETDSYVRAIRNPREETHRHITYEKGLDRRLWNPGDSLEITLFNLTPSTTVTIQNQQAQVTIQT